MIEIMLDLEMASVLPNGQPLQLAAASFTCNPNMVCAPARIFSYYCCDWETAGGEIDVPTMEWWRSQGPAWVEMQKRLKQSQYTTQNVLDLFADWISEECKGQEIGGIWGYPATSDLMWLECAYRRHGYRKLPWEYHHARDLHTLEKVLGEPNVGPFQGMEHDAMMDVLHQVKKVWALKSGV